jgi:hypothetical protein
MITDVNGDSALLILLQSFWYADVGLMYDRRFYLKNGVFWDITLCGSCKSRRFGET